MNKAWPLVGMSPKPPASGCFCFVPHSGGSMIQALNRVTIVFGKGTKRRNESAIGSAKQVAMTMILISGQHKASLQCSNASTGETKTLSDLPILLVLSFSLLERILRVPVR